MPKDVRVFDVINGHRVMRTVTIDPSYKVRFLGFPTTIKYVVSGKTYSYGDVADFVSGEYPYKAYVPDVANGDKYEEVNSTFVLSGGDVTLEQNLQPEQVTIFVRVKDTNNDMYVNDAVIYVDGIRRNFSNSATYVPVKVPIGRRVISAVKGDISGVVTGTITLADENRQQDILMSSSSNLSEGYVIFKSDPPGASITINGQPNPDGNLTPDDVSNLPSGLINFRLDKEGFKPYESSVNVPEGSGVFVLAKMEPLPTTATVTFTSNTADVSLFINKEFKGTMPLTLVLGPGVYSYSASKIGFNTREDTQFAVVAGGNYPFYVEMTEISYPPRGQFIKFVCQNYDRYQELHDGNGGTYTELVERNSASCNFPQGKTISISANVSCTINIYDIYDVKVATGTYSRSTSNNFQTPTPLSFTLGYGNYKVEALPNDREIEGYYGPIRQDLLVSTDVTPQSVVLTLPEYTYRRSTISMTVNLRETGVSTFGDTNGFGGIVSGVFDTMSAYVNLKEYISSGNFTGSFALTMDSPYYYSGEYQVSRSNPYVAISNLNPLPAGAKGIQYLWDSSTIQKSHISGQSEMYRVRSSEFQWKVEGWWFDDGACTIVLNLPVTYWEPPSAFIPNMPTIPIFSP